MNIYRNKVAVITGAGSGIGRALAIDLSKRGAQLAISDINEAGLQETVALCEMAQENVQIRSYKLDVSQKEEVLAHAALVQQDFGAVHYLFNNAGVTLAATFEQSTIEEIEWQLGINLWGVIYGTKAFLPFMLKQGEGHIVNFSSIFGLIGFYGQSAYNVSKFGVRGLTECLWWELEGTGVKATTVHPGGIKTNIGAKARFGKHASQRILDLEHRFGELLLTPPEECARTILDGVAKGKKRIVTGHKAGLVDRISRLLPSSYHALVKRDIKI